MAEAKSKGSGDLGKCPKCSQVAEMIHQRGFFGLQKEGVSWFWSPSPRHTAAIASISNWVRERTGVA